MTATHAQAHTPTHTYAWEHTRLRQNELATHNRIQRTYAVRAAAIPQLLTIKSEPNPREIRNMWFQARNPYLWSRRRTPWRRRRPCPPRSQATTHLRDATTTRQIGSTHQSITDLRCGDPGPRQIGSPAARGARIGRLTFPERGGSIQLPLRHRGLAGSESVGE